MRCDFPSPSPLSSHRRCESLSGTVMTMPAKMAAPVPAHLEEGLAKIGYLLSLLWLLWDHMHDAG